MLTKRANIPVKIGREYISNILIWYLKEGMIMEIGKKIMDLRKKNGLSQEELAEKVGVARQTISKWELGETSPDLKQSKELSKIFKVSLDELTDNDIKDILVEKTSNTEKLAGLILKLLKFVPKSFIF